MTHYIVSTKNVYYINYKFIVTDIKCNVHCINPFIISLILVWHWSSQLLHYRWIYQSIKLAFTSWYSTTLQVTTTCIYYSIYFLVTPRHTTKRPVPTPRHATKRPVPTPRHARKPVLTPRHEAARYDATARNEAARSDAKSRHKACSDAKLLLILIQCDEVCASNFFPLIHLDATISNNNASGSLPPATIYSRRLHAVVAINIAVNIHSSVVFKRTATIATTTNLSLSPRRRFN